MVSQLVTAASELLYQTMCFLAAICLQNAIQRKQDGWLLPMEWALHWGD
uniref:Uncharacterized protein n=1 Tax=Anguilla anguilla TaxID=7936 RepID=A0A0E9RPY5_ANGAN